MKLCKDCKYLHLGVYCHSPMNGISPIDGLPTVRFATLCRSTLYMFDETPKCGPSGEHFSPIEKETVENPWWKFWK